LGRLSSNFLYTGFLDFSMGDEIVSGYSGLLSSFREWHVFVFGLFVGVLVGWSKSLRHEIRKEVQYVVSGVLLGAVVSFVFREVVDV